MRIGFAVEKNEGLDSQVYGHFHAAQLFLVCDVETGSITAVNNEDLGHTRRACSPLKAIGGQSVDAIVVGGIGLPALSELNGQGILVYASVAPTVNDNLRLAIKGILPVITFRDACCGFGPPQGCPNAGDGVCNRKDNEGLIAYPA